MDIITAIRMWIAGIRIEMRARRREALQTVTVNYLVIGSRKDAPLSAGLGTGGS